MRYLGYVCINESMKPDNFRNLRLKSIEKKGIEYLEAVVLHNIKHLNRIIDYNIKNDIYFYRVPSFLVPFATHPVVLENFNWHYSKIPEVHPILNSIKAKVIKHGLRLSAHPDPFNVLNSPKKAVIEKSVLFLDHQNEILESVGGMDIIMHIGGVYGDKKKAIHRFIETSQHLKPDIKNKLRIENDDTRYNLKDVTEISAITGIPVVFDFHHHRCLPSPETETEELIKRFKRQWGNRVLKCHLSSGATYDADRKHSDYVKFQDFLALEKLMSGIEYDLMLEVRKKEKALFDLRKKLKN